MTDPISDMIIRIKNTGAVGGDSVVFPYSKIKEEICNTLQKEGYLKTVSTKGKDVRRSIKVELIDNKIEGLRRVSKYSQRRYSGAKELRPVKHGRGRLILTTPLGVMTDLDAKKANVGGEVILEVW
ncbi:MAG: 30S ribosomal protein S8 [Candidatus Pacebacteria bacterium]|nr:30S ribosomal protein S8 [Candidatus Paceibacterota bacterium]